MESPRPEHGLAREVGPGVLWMRMPLPFGLDHINVWAIRDGEGWALVDTGIQSPETVGAWLELTSESGALGGRPVTRVVATHMHPDHVGLAGWLTRKFHCPLHMSRLEYLACRVLAADTGREAPEDAIRFYRRAGWNEASIELYRARFGRFGKLIHALPDSFLRLQDGERLRLGEHEWEVVVGTGHSPEHACLYCRELRLLVSGDQVLPGISSNVSVFPMEPEADPLGEWLDSIARLRARVADDVLVLCAHNEPFSGLHARLEQLERGHRVALDRLRESLREPKRAVDVFGALFARRVGSEPNLLGLATGESIANLNYLVHRGEALVEERDGGVLWYRLR